MTPQTERGPRHHVDGDRNATGEPFHGNTDTVSSDDSAHPCLPMRASLALAMRGRSLDWRTVHDVAGRDADTLASEVEAYEVAMAHLAEQGLVGIEPGWVTSVRRLSRRWL